MGGSRTVFEFTGSEADRDHRGSRGTFMGATLDLSNTKEERESNLRSGPSTWIFLAVALLLGGGGVAYAMLGAKSEASPEPAPVAAVAAVDQAVPDPAEGEAKAASSGEGSEGDSGGETADGGSGGEAKADAPADDTKADAPAEAPKADAPAEPAEPEEPAKPASTKKPTSTKKPSTKKPSTKKPSTKTDSKPGKLLKPKKPPRDPLSNLPKPPG